jgi:UDP-N-acetylmuramyl pentapeptide phosphotransferase/UDP-N-acetylglucosamine-1-phosphate transferase
MPSGAGLLGWIAIYFMIGLAGTWIARRYAMHHRLLDEPGERRSHAVATPRGGGISVVAALLLAFLALATWRTDRSVLLLASGSGLLLVATVGWIDDHRPLSAPLRLLVHAAAAGILAVAVYQENGSLTGACIVFAVALILVNVWNFMDGIDGLAASQAVIVALGYALCMVDQVAFAAALALAAATCGFLPFNFPKARIFLGDVGSGSLGFGLATLLALEVAAKPSPPSMVQFVFLVPLSAFMIDASLTLMKRIVRGERWWTAHVEHAYQRWAARSQGHVVVTTAYAIWTAMGVGLMLSVQWLSALAIMTSVFAWHLVAVFAWIRLQGRGRVSSQGRKA